MMRPDLEIQRAHDILHFLGTPEGPPVFASRAAVHAAHDALAWVLGYPCGEAFQGNLDYTLETLRSLGYQEIDAGELISNEEAKKRGLA